VLGSVAAGAVLSVILGVAGASASTISLDAFQLAHSGTGSLGIASQGTADIAGDVWSNINLSYANDWIEFHVTPTSQTDVNVNVFANPRTGKPSFTNETYQIAQGAVGGPVVLGPTFDLKGGVEYFLELNSTGVVRPIGQSHFQLSVEAPAPAALPLFAAGLGFLGFIARRRKTLFTALR
jgi:hypothetical protein